MATRTAPPVPKGSPAVLVLAFAAMYILWGTSYLGIRFSLESFTPFMVPALRFAIAGVVLFPIALLAGAALPRGRQWRNCAISGVIMFVFNNALLVWCQNQGIPSGLASILIATSPFWFVLFNWVQRGERPAASVVVGLLIGFGGIALLINPSMGTVPLLPALGTLAAAMFWVAGSLFARDADMPASPMMTTAVQLLAGGAVNIGLAVISGEMAAFDPAAISAKSWASVVYLAIASSIIALSAYMYLLRRVSSAWVSTYAYVNPVVAVALGWLLAGERLQPQTLLAAAIVLVSVVVITGGRRLNPAAIRTRMLARRARLAAEAEAEAERTHVAAPGG